MLRGLLMIQKIRLQNFKGHVDTEVPLGRLTMLVGDNASGKTSVLDALWLQAALYPDPTLVLKDDFAPEDLVRRGSTGPAVITGAGASPTSWSTVLKIDPSQDTPDLDGVLAGKKLSSSADDFKTAWELIPATWGRAGFYRLQANKIAAPAYSYKPDPEVEIDGSNAAAVLAALKLGNDELFDRIEAATRKLIPSVKRIRIRQAMVKRSPKDDVVGHKIYFDFKGAANVPAHGASQGTLIALTLLTILHGPKRPNLILLDDFDHALHPKAQIELVKMIKELLALKEFSDLQIVATTHSPYSLDGMDPSDIQVFTLRPEGTVISKRLSQHPDAVKSKGALSAGQLWSLDSETDWVLGK